MKKLYTFFAALTYTMATYPVTVTNNLDQDIITQVTGHISGIEIGHYPFAIKPGASWSMDDIRSLTITPAEETWDFNCNCLPRDASWKFNFNDLKDEQEIIITQQMLDQYIQNERMRICCEKSR